VYAIIGEDNSDVETLKVLVKRIAKTPNLSVRTKGYTGGPQLLERGAAQLNAYRELGCNRFIICYDCDNELPAERYKKIIDRIINKSDLRNSNSSESICALVPVQEIESWILADLSAVSKIISSWKPTACFSNPEVQESPKEELAKLSRNMQRKPLYNHVVHNPRVAEHLKLDVLATKCPSSLPLFEVVLGHGGNVPQLSPDNHKDRLRKVLRALG